MKKYLLRISGLASLALLLHTSLFAQEDSNQEKDNDNARRYDEIVIKHKGDKNTKLTIEIKDGEILVDGKPLDEYDDSTVSIRRQKVTVDDGGNALSFFSPDFLSPDAQGFTGAHSSGSSGSGVRSWSYSGDDAFRRNRSFLGVGSEKTPDGKGVRVVQVTRGSAAEKLGLHHGDIITKVDDTEITDPESLSTTISQHQPGDKVTLTFSREGKTQKVTGTLGKARGTQVEPFNNFQLTMPDLKGFSDEDQLRANAESLRVFRDLSGNSLKFGIRAQDMDEGKGVKVLDVDDESTAAKAGIKEGDILTHFDGKEINSVTALTEAAHAAKDKSSVKVELIRDGKPQEVEVRVPKRLRTADL